MNLKKIGLLVFVTLLALVIIFNRGEVTLTSQNNFKLQPISANGFALQSDIQLYNPNILSCTVKSIHEKFKVNGVVLGILDQEINQGIPGRKESAFPVTIRFGKDEYNRAAGADSSNPGKVNFQVEGEITFTNVINNGKINVQQSGTDSSTVIK